jgi:hypothetical protein
VEDTVTSLDIADAHKKMLKDVNRFKKNIEQKVGVVC